MEGAAGPPPRKKRRAVRKGSTAATAGDATSNLPDHILCDILLRLPLKSLFSCRQVCKTWRNLVLEPYFGKLHLSRSPLSIILHRPSNHKDPSHFGIIALGDPARLRRRNITLKFTSEIHIPSSRLEIVGSCNGLICLSRWSNDTVIVCNPIRAKYFILPKSPKPAAQSYYYTRFGLGYSPSSDQFKVVRFVSTYGPSRFGYDLIFTLGDDDSWRSFGGAEQRDPINFSSVNFRFVCLNGALHWIVKDDSRFIICYIDIETEQFGNLPLPSHIGDPSMCLGVLSSQFGVVDNSLYISDDYSSPTVVNIWVMKDYGDIGSLTLEWIIKRPFPHGLDGELKPVKTLMDGTLLIIFNRKTLASYNPETRVLEKIKYHGVRFWEESVADVPSFLYPSQGL